MSTKIWVAYRFPKGRLNEFMVLTKNQVYELAGDRAMRILDSLRPEFIRLHAQGLDDPYLTQEMGRSWRCNMLIRQDVAREELFKKASLSYMKNEIFLLDCSISMRIHGKYCYAIPVAAEWIAFNLKYPIWVQKYHYWNNTDRDKELTEREWTLRGRTWEAVFKEPWFVQIIIDFKDIDSAVEFEIWLQNKVESGWIYD